MALLRNGLRSCSLTLRHFVTEALRPGADPEKLTKGHVRSTPTYLIKQGDFTMNKWLDREEPMKHDDWLEARKELLLSEKFEITEATVDMIIVNLCLNAKKTMSAMEYLGYLWETRGEMNLSSMITYLKLCYTKESGELDETERKYLLAIYDTVRAKYPIFDAFTGECCVLGISKTKRWKESFEIFDMIKLSCKPRSATYSAIISAAFDNNEPEIGWKYLNEALVRLNPEHRTYRAYLDYCKRNYDGAELEKAIGRMFKFWGDRDVRPYSEVIEAYERTLRELGWHTERTSIRDSGICRTCSHRLSNLKISQGEFAKLVDLVRERVIIGDDVYQKTTPRELKNFLAFVERSKPWDVVIDGLNVAYLSKTAHKSNGYMVRSAVKLCVDLGKKVLVLGRKHMAKWPQMDLKYIQQNAHIFLAENGTADDPYLLYATLSSGPATMFVSRDLMRQHKFLLEDPDITRIFKYWQMAHQFSPVAITSKQRTPEIKLTSPPNYLPVVQNDENGWHVPFTFESSLQPPLIYEPPRSWFCFRKKGPPTRIGNSSVP